MKLSSYIRPIFLLLFTVAFSLSNANAQSSKVKCPKKKSFWKSNRTSKKLVSLPKIKVPEVPSVKLPKVKLPTIKKPEVSLPEINTPSFAIQKSRRTASTKCPH